ncbi:DUF2268 domain-containing protein [Celeribacter indicus]|uniref:DUF2268 domain-containing protein n=1 Tax=Celeribacter indicus TaxID=1208324 RepID=A0A0B5E3N1_9RHOB|nr:DUF2268 domain-containing putative Zn-dependent protease [Celeribacter indicus]AJE47661.1 hypothetical protein P73_2946 [Celeribacter indicus]SDW13522.1 Predicted Zn-dependent protease [Celeribacter indicus]
MTMLNFHVLDARGHLSGDRDWLLDRLRAAYASAAPLLPLGPLDVVLRAGDRVIPEKGHLGYAPEAGRIEIVVDPANPALRDNRAASLERMFAHELHHAARWEGPGYGATLGEALVSEGLAGQFSYALYGPPVEPWDALPMNEVRAHFDRAAEDWTSGYDHARWFFGTGDLPRWLGYSIGYLLVGRLLSTAAGLSAAGLVHAPALRFRAGLKMA